MTGITKIITKFERGQKVKCIANKYIRQNEGYVEGTGWVKGLIFTVGRITIINKDLIVYFPKTGSGVYEQFLQAVDFEWNEEENK